MLSEGELINLQDVPLHYFQLSTMPTAEKLVLKKKLKSELAQLFLAINNIAGLNNICNSDRQFSLSSESCQALMGRKRKTPEMDERQRNVDNSYSEEIMVTEKSGAASTVTGASKGDNPGSLDSKEGKGQKAASTVTGASRGHNQGRLDSKEGKGQNMDLSKMRQCAMILKKLMTHPAGWVFNQPVDPVKLKIPDYFSIISKPMDLGTIKGKLERKLYLSTNQFAADVRLTFSNAMRYNPPGNNVHIMAKELNNIFSLRWKSLEEKWRQDTQQHSTVSEAENQTPTSRQTRCENSDYSRSSLPRRALTCADKPKPRTDVPHADAKKCDQDFVQDASKGRNGTGLKHGCVTDKTLTSLSACRSFTCGTLDCHCSTHNDFTQAASSDVDSERSLRRESHACHAHDLDARTTTRMRRADLDPDSCEAVVVDEDNAWTNSCPSTPPATCRKGDYNPSFEEPLSPSKALRAAILKSRFADTILKAQQKTLLNHGEKVDPAKMQREREKLEKRQQEEKARIEAQVKAAEAAARMKAETELKMQREREREAARLALQKLEKTVDIDENTQILKDLEFLSYSQPGNNPEIPDEVVVNFMNGVELHFNIANPLEKLGLFMKNDDLDEEADDWIMATGNGDVEEGEIGCR